MSRKSKMMDQLYGVQTADLVYDRLQNLDPILNEEIQRIAYDHFWARPGLSVKEKSFVTVVSLITLGKEEQIRIHFNGYLNAGGTAQQIKGLLKFFFQQIGAESANKGLIALNEVLMERQQANEIEDNLGSILNHPPFDLDNRDRNIATMVSAVALGNLQKMKIAMIEYLEKGGSPEEARNILIHQIVYCGFPTAMNGFAVLQDVTKNR